SSQIYTLSLHDALPILDWVGVCWDADFRRAGGRWSFHDFLGASWRNVRDARRQTYLANAYRVLLTRARQGMVIYVPPGDEADHRSEEHTSELQSPYDLV